MRSDINELKRMMSEALRGTTPQPQSPTTQHEVVGLLPALPESERHSYDYEEVIEVVDDETPVREVTKDDVQREQIIEALKRHNYRRKAAAKELFISERTLYRKMKALGIDDTTK